jgi:hypothetical protein
MNRWAEPVLYTRPHRKASAFAGMLDSLTSLTHTEPDETFADKAVVAAGEELFRRFQQRVREASDLP